MGGIWSKFNRVTPGKPNLTSNQWNSESELEKQDQEESVSQTPNQDVIKTETPCPGCSETSPGTLRDADKGNAVGTFERTEGLNKAKWFYAEASKTSGISRASRRNYLIKASKLYLEESKNTQRTSFELSSIWRNIGMCNLKLALVVDELKELLEIYWIMEALKNSIKAFLKALDLRRGSINEEWGLLVQEKLLEAFEIAFGKLGLRNAKPDPKMWSQMDELFKLLPNQGPLVELIGNAYLKRSLFWYNSAIIALEGQDFRKSSQYLEYARQDLCSSSKFAIGNSQLESEHRITEGDIYNHGCSTESKRVFELADLSLTKAIFDSEEIDLRQIWAVVDQFKDAALLTRDKDLESEAKAMSRIGRIYTKVFNMPKAGHKYYKEAFTLAQSLSPKDLSGLDWMIETKEAMEAYQQKVYTDEQKKLDELKAPYLEKLAPVLQEIKKVRGIELLKHVFANHPPKCKYEFDKENFDHSNLRSYLKKSIIYYHPDRQKDYDMEWQVLSGEITKYLTASYEVTKGID